MNDSRSKLAILEELQQDRCIRRSLALSACSDSEINDVLKASSTAVTELAVEHNVVHSTWQRRCLDQHGIDD